MLTPCRTLASKVLWDALRPPLPRFLSLPGGWQHECMFNTMDHLHLVGFAFLNLIILPQESLPLFPFWAQNQVCVFIYLYPRLIREWQPVARYRSLIWRKRHRVILALNELIRLSLLEWDADEEGFSGVEGRNHSWLLRGYQCALLRAHTSLVLPVAWSVFCLISTCHSSLCRLGSWLALPETQDLIIWNTDAFVQLIFTRFSAVILYSNLKVHHVKQILTVYLYNNRIQRRLCEILPEECDLASVKRTQILEGNLPMLPASCVGVYLCRTVVLLAKAPVLSGCRDTLTATSFRTLSVLGGPSRRGTLPSGHPGSLRITVDSPSRSVSHWKRENRCWIQNGMYMFKLEACWIATLPESL